MGANDAGSDRITKWCTGRLKGVPMVYRTFLHGQATRLRLETVAAFSVSESEKDDGLVSEYLVYRVSTSPAWPLNAIEAGQLIASYTVNDVSIADQYRLITKFYNGDWPNVSPTKLFEFSLLQAAVHRVPVGAVLFGTNSNGERCAVLQTHLVSSADLVLKEMQRHAPGLSLN